MRCRGLLGVVLMVALLGASSWTHAASARSGAAHRADLVNLAPQLVGLKGAISFTIPADETSDGSPCGLLAYSAGGGAPNRPAPSVTTIASSRGWSFSASDVVFWKLAWSRQADVGDVSATTFSFATASVASTTGAKVLLQFGTSRYGKCPKTSPGTQASPIGPAYPIEWVINTMPRGDFSGLGCGFMRLAGGGGTYNATILLSQALPIYTNFDRVTCPITDTAARENAIPHPWQNCKEVNARWPHGVGRSGAHDLTSRAPVKNFTRSDSLYATALRLNQRLDPDRDGIACERK